MEPSFRFLFWTNSRYFRYSFLAASKNNKSNLELSLGITSKAFPTITSILSARPASSIFFLAMSAIGLSISIVITFPFAPLSVSAISIAEYPYKVPTSRIFLGLYFWIVPVIILPLIGPIDGTNCLSAIFSRRLRTCDALLTHYSKPASLHVSVFIVRVAIGLILYLLCTLYYKLLKA